MTRYTVPRQVIGIESPDGTKYDSHHGHIEVDNPRHLDQITRSVSGVRGEIGLTPFAFTEAAGRDCPRCAFAAFAWSAACPRCGTPLHEQEVADATAVLQD